MSDNTTQAPAFNPDASLAAAAQAESAEILNLLNETESGEASGGCCGGACCSSN